MTSINESDPLTVLICFTSFAIMNLLLRKFFSNVKNQLDEPSYSPSTSHSSLRSASTSSLHSTSNRFIKPNQFNSFTSASTKFGPSYQYD